MSGSLQDQLLKAGLTDEGKAKQLTREKRKAEKRARGSGQAMVDENKLAAQQVLAEKAQRDRELNQVRDSKALRKAINAQIKQLVERNKLPRASGEIGFNFTDGKRVKTLYVTPLQHRQLAVGALVVVKQGDQYELLPRPVADKIAERDENRVIRTGENSDKNLTDEEKDWYKDYEIPDDLMW